MTVKIAITGALGRMGQAIARIALESPDQYNVAALVDKEEFTGRLYSEMTSLPIEEKICGSVAEITANVDVVIDFSFHEVTPIVAAECAQKGFGLVVGTTGLTPEEIEKVEEHGNRIPILISPNMSMGVNVILESLKLLTKALHEKFDIEIVEAHHNKKVDAPSGTALKLLDVIQQSLPDTDYKVLHGREGLIGAREKKEIAMHAVRGGTIVGEHSVIFAGHDEQVILEHRAASRDIFARGAVFCAGYLSGKTPGLYTIKQALGI